MNRDELNGRMDKAKGKVKQAAGDLTDNERLHDEGVADEAEGSVQEGFGRARRKVGEAIEDIGDDIKR
jgi:uncharacterized protein YjbJ (UPF0337 family)